MSPTRPADDFAPAASWRNIRLRATVRQELRDFFQSRGFVEVDTPLLSADTVVDRHLDPLTVVLFEDPRFPDRGPRQFLQTSPEFHMKRLLASDDAPPAIYQVTRAFRGGERGTLHNPEFSIVEWYRVGDSYDQGINLLDELSICLFDRGPAERITYASAFHRFAGLDPFQASQQQLWTAYRDVVPQSKTAWAANDRDTLMDLIMCDLVQPKLGRKQPVILTDYPPSHAALAQTRIESGCEVAERFELFVDGMELANGYHELLDVTELLIRNSETNRFRQAAGKPRLPESSRLEAAMRHGLAKCCGVALGFDRVVMLRAGAEILDDVLPFPSDRA